MREHFLRFVVALKGFGIIQMCIIHSVFFVSLVYQTTLQQFFPDNIWKFFLFNGCVGLSLPAIAGMALAYSEEQTQFRNWNFKFGFNFFLGLFFLDGLRSYLITGQLNNFIFFNVLGFIGLSFCLIAYFEKKRAFGIYLFCIFCLIVNYFSPLLRDNLLISGVKIGDNIDERFKSWVSIACIALTIIATVATYLNNKSKIKFLISISVIGVFVYFFHESVLNNPVAIVSFLNFPIAIFIGQDSGLHTWPLLIWFPIVAFGYSLCKVYLRSESVHWSGLAFLALCILYIIFYVHVLYDGQFFGGTVGPQIISKGFFNTSVYNLFFVIAYFVNHCAFVGFLNYHFRFDRLKVFNSLSRWILVIYIFHMVFQYYLAIFLRAHSSFVPALAIVASSSVLLSIIFARILDIVFIEHRFRISFRKRGI